MAFLAQYPNLPPRGGNLVPYGFAGALEKARLAIWPCTTSCGCKLVHLLLFACVLCIGSGAQRPAYLELLNNFLDKGNDQIEHCS